MNTGHFKSINIIRESIHLNSNPRYSTIFMEWFSAMFTIGNMSENTFCLYGFNTLHSTEKRNPIFHVSHCLTYFTYHNDLTETEEIKKRGQEYTEELYKKGLHDPEKHNDHSPRARHPGMRSQVGLMRHYYKQS